MEFILTQDNKLYDTSGASGATLIAENVIYIDNSHYITDDGKLYSLETGSFITDNAIKTGYLGILKKDGKVVREFDGAEGYEDVKDFVGETGILTNNNKIYHFSELWGENVEKVDKYGNSYYSTDGKLYLINMTN